LKRDMMLKRVLDELLRGCADSFLIGVLHGSYWGVLLVNVAAGEGSIVGASMVVGSTNCVESVNDIRVMGASATTVGTLGSTSVTLNGVKWSVRHIAGISLRQ
jgi:hypothetical protein